MGTMSLWHWIVVFVVFFFVLFPTAKILRKAGYSGWWCLFAFVPFLNWIMLWVFAYASWPNLRSEER